MDVTSYLLGKNSSGGGGGQASTIYPTTISFKSNTDEIIDLSNVSFSKFSSSGSIKEMFRGCTNVKELQFNNFSAELQSIQSAFYDCKKLETANFDTFNLGGVLANSGLQNAFANCSSLTDASLDKILVMLMTSPITNTLAYVGIKNYSQERIQALPHYQAFIDAGWTIS